MRTVTKLSDTKGTPREFVKKPIVVRAIELQETIRVKTREGLIFGYAGDFLIEGVQKEVYPCGREIFFKTYSEVQPQ